MTLKEVRMWHWREAMRYRGQQHRYEKMALDQTNSPTAASHVSRMYQRKFTKTAVDYERKADFHIRCVQAMNIHFTSTAEADCAAQPHLKFT